ncbi:SDR family NAD(P)-dependent oxidoreductase [Marivirga salinae]|uniref:SDR family NAD(P)-dependent oxidoreductase n=1 Tax=Marivirga salinarum TaxID=3059078 RepID=A0AA51NAP1_9BACT|nr:SDR family NAD(P)-dependent oxidoreductase [Marivirga sp. BDSF4-3]WMN11544.1 SDR family NAD(P)-dependent oxidoreductase [Marivirga sp. BDSF4-3]
MKILITGGTNGIGKGVAKILAGLDDPKNEIIILCRSEKLGKETIKEFKRTTSNTKISMVLCDLTKLSDVKSAIEEVQSKHKFLDGIFINAGIGYAAKRVETGDGMDSHFQVNYLSQFMLTLGLLNLLEKSENGGRVIFNVTTVKDKIFWDDIQMRNNWSFEKGIHQAMVAKRMFLNKLHNLYQEKKDSRLSFIGFEISETVWSNQVNIIPYFMKTMATLMKWLGQFISVEKCGEIMAPLFIENQKDSLNKSGKIITWKKNDFIVIKEKKDVLNQTLQDKLWEHSIRLCKDEKTSKIAENLCN